MARYRYRLGWRSLRYVVGRADLTRSDYKSLALDLGEAMRDHHITTRRRAAMFIAQTCHESGGYRWREELASGALYEWRRDLGNVVAGDGVRYKGRGYIQITGRFNYRAISKALRIDFLGHPWRLSERRYAALSAAWWWESNGVNRVADTGDFVAVTRRINGGTNGLADRRRYYARARRVSRFLVPKRRRP